jgi:uncharacterized protein YbjQ (UPF0145 family)
MPLGRQQINLQQSLQNMRGGGLPIRAQMRLAEEAGPNKRLFTSDLSVSEFLLTREASCQTISQVMGSSIYHIGVIADYKGATSEIAVISQAHRESRRLALSRLYLEAQMVQADAVIGVRLEERFVTGGSHGKGGDDGGEVIEFTVVGTAIRAPWITHKPGQPVITDLNGQDLWALAKDGFEPCGFLFDFCRYHVWHVKRQGAWQSGGELDLASQGIEEARTIVLHKLDQQAVTFDAEFVVGADVKLKVREVPCGYGGCELNDLDIDLSCFGTGVRRIPGFKPPTHSNIPPLILSMMPLGRRKSELLEGEEDESEAIEEAAREQEEQAAEADEKKEE